MIEVTKEVTFDCAHMLAGHKGLCKNLHGHTYKVLVTVIGDDCKGRDDDLLVVKGPAEGMTIDFKQLKGILETVIIEQFDHAFIYDVSLSGETDPETYAAQAVAETVTKWGLKSVAFIGRPTAENMASYFGHALNKVLRSEIASGNILGCKVVSVKVYETPTSYAEWHL